MDDSSQDRAFPVALEDISLRRELVARGWTDRDIAHHVRSGVLTKIRYGAYVRTPLLEGLDEVGLMRMRARAVLRTAHPSSALSHQASLAEWEIPLWGVDLTQTDLTRSDGKSGRREAGVVHHRGLIDEDDIVLYNGVRTVKLARAVIEVILSHPPETGLVAATGALNLDLVTPKSLADAVASTDRWPNSLHARTVLARAVRGLTSVAEARAWHLFHEFHIARPEPQVEVHDESGDLVGIVDFLWRSQGVFLEVDGKAKYTKFRRPGETLDDYLMREKRREELICQITGWVCIRITWADLHNPIRTARRIRAVLESRAKPVA